MKTKIITLLSVLALSTISMAQIINVPEDQPTIQAGINVADSGDTVLVEQGTYYENINFQGKAITVSSQFLMNGDTSLISSTIIDGSQPANPDSASVVYFISGEDTTSIIKGFTIQGGNGTPSSWGNGISGGGVFCEGSGPTIAFNKIINNQCVGTGSFISGGGIFSDSCFNRMTIIKYNLISNNSCANINSTTQAVTGGGICVLNNAFIHDNTISNNSIYNGYNKQAVGGGVDASMAKFPIINNTISGNITQNVGSAWIPHGGGIYGQDQHEGTLISGNLIEVNKLIANKPVGGGIAIWRNEGRVTIDKNIIRYNDACKGAGIAVAINHNIEITNNLIQGNAPLDNNNNSLARGGGIYLNAPNQSSKEETGFRKTGKKAYNPSKKTQSKDIIPVVVNNTIIENESYNGGGINVYYGINPLVIFNNIIFDNIAVNSGNAMCLLTNTTTYLYNNDIDVTEISGLGMWEGEGNIFEDPLFETDGYHLTQGSPCIESGMNSIEIDDEIYYCPDHDIDGQLRPLNETADIGADEVLITSIPESEFLNNDQMLQNFPNPFNESTTISFELESDGYADLSIYDLTGKKIRTLISENKQAGIHKIEMGAKWLDSGVYFCVLKTNEGIQTKKIIKL